MKLEQKKLEELLYLSLIGRFELKSKVDFRTYLCFTSVKACKEGELKPIYITETNAEVSDDILLKRVNSFENKIFKQEKNNNEELNYIKRIKNFVKNLDKKSTQKVLMNLKHNLGCLEKEEIIDSERAKISYCYVEQLAKDKENIHTNI